MSSVDLLACSRLSDGGEGAKDWGRRERERLASPLLAPVVCVLRFPNFRGSTAYAHRIFVVIGSLFLNFRLHSI